MTDPGDIAGGRQGEYLPGMAQLEHEDPIQLFGVWFDEAVAAGTPMPEAMALATASKSGAPSVRTVLLKGHDARGFVFYTNLASHKARALAANPRAELGFHFEPLKRQVRISGGVEPVSAAEADAYFATRPRDSQLGAWASRQSEPLPDLDILHRRVAEFGAKFAGQPVPRPPFWSGFRVVPTEIEFWVDRDYRLHERMHYRRDQGGTWSRQRLYP